MPPQEERRLERHRPGAVTCSGPISTSRIWADLRSTPENDPRLEASARARLDTVKSEARAADGLAFNRIIRDLYVAYDGPAAAQTNQDEPAGAAMCS